MLGNPLTLTDPSGMVSGSPCENNTACMSQIPGCLQNPDVCASTYFAPDPVQVVPDPFQLLSIPVKVWSYVPGTAPQATYLTFPSGTTSATITFGTPNSGSWQWTQVGTDFNLLNSAIPIGMTGEPNTTIVRPQGYDRVSQYEYGPSGQLQYRYDWGDPHGGRTTDPHLHVIDMSRRGDPSGEPINVPSRLAPPKPWRPDGPYSTYPKGAPPILTAPSTVFDIFAPICVSCRIMMQRLFGSGAIEPGI